MKTLPSIILIILTLLAGFAIGHFIRPNANFGDGAGCPNTVNQALSAKCACPAINPVYSVGCDSRGNYIFIK